MSAHTDPSDKDWVIFPILALGVIGLFALSMFNTKVPAPSNVVPMSEEVTTNVPLTDRFGHAVE